ncbi:NADPH:quinone reductase [Paenibacillus sp. J31TS4]|uniref:NAD(P)-dependent alcohol dehydrogenase n=1 Tax=Paenibacillus sp. J31TS4 TaxID=2807195 RepID=UPI001B1DEAB5|nr:NAD(P)-dependent alcohol dehydrogenase [Paenibacillus sp. J31TS4]GIP38174.1 NADPH:quinone reductase [Paenibacillus sp. J31TS4]
MKAIVCTKYGPPEVLRLAEVPAPAPKAHEVLVKVGATTVASGDLRVRGFNSPLLLWLPMRIVLGLRRPRKPILGVELAGEVVEVGGQVQRFRKGDRVFALTGMQFGAHAEYACLHEDGVAALMPAGASYEEAAALPMGGTTALYFLRKGSIRSGQRVLVYGASGAVGTLAVQLAKHFGADVTGVCSTANLELVKALGADRAVDYTKEAFADGRERYDLVFDAVGKLSKAACRKALAPGGAYVTVDGQGIAKVTRDHLMFLKELMEVGAIRPVIDRRYPLEQIPDAHRYVEQGRKRGSVVIQVAAPSVL